MSQIDRLLGEQSVGKSYMLNHLVDSSFAGSAMRTTGDSCMLNCANMLNDLL